MWYHYCYSYIYQADEFYLHEATKDCELDVIDAG